MSDHHSFDSWVDRHEEPRERADDSRPAPNITVGPAFGEREASGYDKRSWWVRRETVKDGDCGRFVDLGGRIDGTETLELHLAPGRYMIGAGPTSAFRREVKIDRDGREVVVRAPCIRPRCSGTIEFRPSAPPTACEAFDLRPPRDRLCEECSP